MRLILVSVVFLFFWSCNTEKDFNETEDVVADTLSQIKKMDSREFLTAAWEEVLEGELELNRNVELEGYLAFPGAYVHEENGQILIHIYPRRNQSMGKSVHFYMKSGEGKNQVNELPEKYLPQDFKVIDENGVAVSGGAKVRVKLTLKEGSGGEKYRYAFHSIEALNSLPEKADVVSDFFEGVELTNEIINDSTQNEIFGWCRGSFELPMMIFVNNGKMRLNFKNESNNQIKSVTVKIGDGSSSMNDLPEDFTENDFVVRDYAGNKLPNRDAIIYGTWHRSERDNNGIFYLEEIGGIRK